jgi:hypothetical protein
MYSRVFTIRLIVVIGLPGCLVALMAVAFHHSNSETRRFTKIDLMEIAPVGNQSVQLAGAQAQQYLRKPGSGKSLMEAITARRFRLQRQSEAADYLALSHVQNLNALFGADGATLRPTVSKNAGANSWHMDMHLKKYGYGENLIPVPNVVSRQVKENRIEYQREPECQLSVANCRFEEGRSAFNPNFIHTDLALSSAQNDLFQSEIGKRKSAITEWYENRPEGIEQGFTINVRPDRKGALQSENLRLVVQLEGELSIHTKDGQTVQIADRFEKPVLSYGKLTAIDANRKKLDSHLETKGNEVTLVIDDRDASYPIVVDPIVASVEQILEFNPEASSQFGAAVAISGDRAIVGVWLDDSGASSVDSGEIFVFKRAGSTWTLQFGIGLTIAQAHCGYSVAISSTTAAWGCIGVNNNAGAAYSYDLINGGAAKELVPVGRKVGDLYGASVATSGNIIVVGSPLTSNGSGAAGQHVGAIYVFQNNVQLTSASGPLTNDQLGTSVALDGDNLLVGAPGGTSGTGKAFILSISRGLQATGFLRASDGDPGDQFGTGVAISDRTAIVAAPGDDDRGPEAGAAYIFISDAASNWSQQQKLTASDGKAGDLFGSFAVAIEFNTVVVGARRNDGVSSNPNDNRGAAYVFTRSATVWTQQTKLGGTAFLGAPGDEFGTSVAISGNTVISGAPHSATQNGTANAGVSYVFRLDCIPPYGTYVENNMTGFPVTTLTICPGTTAEFGAVYRTPTLNQPLNFQWRKNGVNIPGATARTLRFTNATVADAGSYDVIVSNACGGEITPVANLVIHSFSLNPTSQNFGASGSNGVVNVTATGSCAWTAVSNSSFITVTSGATGSGNGSVSFSVAANATSTQRTGSITIAGQTFNITQDGTTAQQSVIQFSASNYSVNEDCTFVSITVNRIGDSSSAATVDYATSDVTANERRDYTTALGKLRFASGETSKTFSVLITEDSYTEGTETFNVNLSNPTGATLGNSVATVQINDDPTEPSTNAIDDAPTFVGQHYHDFLNRQADPSGLNFWTNQITSCGTDQACIQLKRINVSAAYFLSIEFQQTGYLVERIYKTAYGNASGTSTFNGTHQLPVPIVRYQEFLRDTQRIGQGVVVGDTGWESTLESNKQAFTTEFVQLPRFTSLFPGSMTATQFVDTLNTNAGNPLSTAERSQLISELSSGAKTRAQVLRAIAEHSNLVTSESNRAFVLMQYFGYLRRNPNDAPDSDYTGYDFWLTKLNQFSGNFVDAEMVKAFITSSEYRSRFGL